MFRVIKCFIFFSVVLMFLISVSNIGFSAPQEISAEGEYRLGDTDTRDKAKKIALADAKRKVVEQAGVYIESYSELNNFELTKDQIKTTASSILKIKSEQVNFYENGTVCKAIIVAIVDTDNIEKYIKNSPLKINSLQQSDYEEYKGHCYKLFNERMTWQEAKKYCESFGGHLVTITSGGEQSFIYDLLMMNGVKNSYWLGAFKGSNGDWRWITNEKFSYNNWGWNQPDGDGNALMIYFSTGNRWPMGVWNDIPTNGGDGEFFGVDNFGFICEWESADDIR